MTITNGEICNSRAGTAGSAYAELDGGHGGNGGAIYNTNILTILNCYIHNNNATNGSNAATTGSVPGSAGCGGAIYNNGNLNITDSNMTANYAGKGGDGCSNKDGAQGGNGGGIYNISILYLQNCILNDNYAGKGGQYSGDQNGGDGGNGGGIYNNNTLTIENCDIYNNKAGNAGDGSDYFQSFNNGGNGGSGGGIYNEGNLTILSNFNIHNNNAGDGGDGHHSGDGGYGGGIYNNGTLNITGNSLAYVQICNNTAGNGGEPDSSDDGGDYGKGGRAGAIYNKGNFYIKYAIISDNNSGKGDFGGDGGAIYNVGHLTLEESIINNNHALFNCKCGVPGDNSAGNGGGIYNTGNLNITNCQITNNKASDGPNGQDADWKKDQYYYVGTDGCNGGSGGGIYNTGTLTINGSSISNNSAGKGGNGGKGEACFKDDEFPPDPPDNDPPEVGNSQVSTLDPGDGANGGNGGGIFNSGTITSITNTIINNNNAGKGGDGGLYFDDISAMDNLYKVNPAIAGIGGSGGGIYSIGKLNSLQNTTINNNTAGNGGNGNPVSRYPGEDGATGGNGGGLVIFNQIEVINCHISNNKAGNGGTGASINIPDYNPSTEPGNGGNGGLGGGIYITNSQNNSEVISITKSIIDNNYAGSGGSPGYDSSKKGNGGNGNNGGGIAITASNVYNLKLMMDQSTITNNHAGNGAQGENGGKNGSFGVGGGLYSGENHYIDVSLCHIVDNAPQAFYLNFSSDNSIKRLFNNWWGTNNDNNELVTQIVGSNIDNSYYAPWIILSINATPNKLNVDQTSKIVADLNWNNLGWNILEYYDYKAWVPDDIPVFFGSNIGFMNPINNSTYMGASNSTFSPNSTPGIATVSATVDHQTVYTTIEIPSADIEVNKTVNNSRPNVGDTVTFTVTVKNNGPDTATNIQIADTIPPHFDNLSIHLSTGTYQNNIWTIPELANGSNATFTITGTVTSSFTGLNTTNTATKIAEDQIDPNPYNDNSSATIYVPIVNISVDQKPWYYDSLAGAYQNWSDYYNVLVYLVEVKNTGPDDATGMIIKELIGNGYEFVGLSTEGAGNATYDLNTRTITWNISNMLANTKACLSIFALVTGIGNNTPELTVNASLYHVDQYDTPGQNKSSSWSIYVPESADIQVNQTQKNSTETDGQYLTYTITVTNNGPNNATAIQITDALPTRLTNPIITPDSGTYTIDSNNKIIWTIPSLNVSEITKLTIKSLINGSGTFVNTAIKTGQGEKDWNYDNNAQTCIFTLSGNYTPEVNMDVYQHPAYYDTTSQTYKSESGYYQTIVYTVTIKNTGPTDATGVIVTDLIGEGYEYIACTTRGVGNAAYDQNTRTITWNVGNVPAGCNAYLSIFALVTATGNNTPELTVNASLSHVDQYDIPNSHKWASYSIYVPGPTGVSNADQQSNLYITGTFQNITVNLGEIFTTTLKLGNKGPHTAKNVIIKIPIPEGLKFITASVDQGTWHYDEKTRTVIWYVGDVKVGDPYITFTFNPQKIGNFVLNPIILTHTYNRYSGDTIIPLNIHINPTINTNGSTAKAATKTIGMQETGIPLPLLILAVLMVLGGLIRRK